MVSGTWNAKDIAKIEGRLNAIRREIDTRLLLDLKQGVRASQSDENEHSLAALSALERIANTLSEHKEDSGTIIEMLNKISIATRDPQRGLLPTPGEQGSCLGTDSQLGKGLVVGAEEAILNWLWYPSMYDREDSIDEAYPKTLHWIFEEEKVDNSEGCKWDSFMDFLKGENRIYWITGKPGSGKSTLVKFINEQDRTQEELNHWSSGKRLLCASFYFSYKGSDEQRTELGLVRSLLHWILTKERNLISLVFKDRYIAESRGTRQSELTLPEAKRTLKQILEQHSELRFFFTIDGLDEFDPDASSTTVASLIDLAETLSGFDNVKMVVSSRPYPEFEYGFSRYPRLRIHDLTKADIRHYATERLGNHSRMQLLIKRDPKNSRELIDSITSMSSGVFLWVRVVTDSLIWGLTKYDNIKDLQRRLEGLPSDLQELYEVIISRIGPEHRDQSSELLELAYYGMNTPLHNFGALYLWFSENADNEMIFQTKTEPLGEEDVHSRIDEMETRLKSRCLGLVEVGPSSIIQFLHKTVKEFLEGPFWKEFAAKHCRTDFVPTLSLLRGEILAIKTWNPPSNAKKRRRLLRDHLVAVGERARGSDLASGRASSDLLRELDSTMTAHFGTISYDLDPEAASRVATSHWSSLLGWDPVKDRYRDFRRIDGTNYRPVDLQSSFLAFATCFRLSHYITEQIEIHGPDLLANNRFPLLVHALSPHRDNIRLVHLLLTNGCDPQQMLEGISVWAWFWHGLYYQLMVGTKGSYRLPLGTFFDPGLMLSMIRTMLRFGADPNILIPWVVYPNKTEKAQWSYCTPLAAMTRLRELLSDNDFVANTRDYMKENTEETGSDLPNARNNIRSIIQLLKEKGGIEQEMELCKIPQQVAVAGTTDSKNMGYT